MTKKKKTIIGVCIGAGVILIGFLIYFFFIRFSIVGKWEKQENDTNWVYINSFEFQSNGDAFIYTKENKMIKGHYSFNNDDDTLTIYFDDNSEEHYGLFLGDLSADTNDKISFNVLGKSGGTLTLLPTYTKGGQEYTESEYLYKTIYKKK